MKKSIVWSIVVVILVSIAVSVIIWRRTLSQPTLSPALVVPQASVEQVRPPTHYPIPTTTEPSAAAGSLPSLQGSDHVLLGALSALLGRKRVSSFFYPTEIVRRIVVTIDNLPRKTTPVQLLPMKPAGGKFLTKLNGQMLSIAPENAKRYATYVHIAEMVDAKRLVALYTHFYPLLQREYQDLGYPDGYFNDRLIEVIDHLITGPDAHDPIYLDQPHVSYRFVDQDMETMSSGRKIMLRIGSENEAKIKEKLREIRKELTKT